MAEFMLQMIVYDETMNLYEFVMNAKSPVFYLFFALGILWGRFRHRKSMNASDEREVNYLWNGRRWKIME